MRTLGVGSRFLCLIRSVFIWLLQASEFSAFVDHAGLVGEGFQLSEVDTVFIACNVDMSKKKLNPERSLSRYEFMEAIVRIAHAKYNKSKLVIWGAMGRENGCKHATSQPACSKSSSAALHGYRGLNALA